MSAVLDHHGDHDHAHDHPQGWRRWVYATNHKDIGTLYLWFSFAMLLVGGVNALQMALLYGAIGCIADGATWVAATEEDEEALTRW